MWWRGVFPAKSRLLFQAAIAPVVAMPCVGTTTCRFLDGCCCWGGVVIVVLPSVFATPLLRPSVLGYGYVQPSGGGGLPPAMLPWAGLPLIALLLPLVLIDFDHMWLPEPLCRWGVLVGLSISTTAGLPVFVDHLIATVLALLALESLSALAERLVGKPALGLGDAKLAAMGGAWLGLWGIALAMGLAVFAGAVVGGVARITGRLAPQQPFPFGPFIALGIWLVWLMGPFWWWEQWQAALTPWLGL